MNDRLTTEQITAANKHFFSVMAGPAYVEGYLLNTSDRNKIFQTD